MPSPTSLCGASPAPGELNVSFESEGADDSGHAKFWKPVVAQLVRLYVEPRISAIVTALSHLDIHLWRQLLDFLLGLNAFFGQPVDSRAPPPLVPGKLFAHLLRAFVACEVSEPFSSRSVEVQAPPSLLYLEAMQLIRLILAPSPDAADSKRSRKAPSRPTQFGLHVLCAPPVEACLVRVAARATAQEAGSTCGRAEARFWSAVADAWEHHGGDVALAWQHVLLRIYPESRQIWSSDFGRRGSVLPKEAPPLTALLAVAAFRFGSAQQVAPPLAGPSRRNSASAAGGSEAAPEPEVWETEKEHGSRKELEAAPTEEPKQPRHDAEKDLVACARRIDGTPKARESAATEEQRQEEEEGVNIESQPSPEAQLHPLKQGREKQDALAKNRLRNEGGTPSAPSEGRRCEGEDDPPSSPRSGMFSGILASLSAFGSTPLSAERSADRFLVALRDVLHTFLGPCPVSPELLPDWRCSSADVTSANAGAGARQSPLDIKVLARMVRTVIRAHYTEPSLLAARAAEREQHFGGGHDGEHGAEVLGAGTFVGPVELRDFVPVTEQGPLRRSQAFMEQSALLQAVQNRLCFTKLEDISGTNEQLESFSLRNLRVLWFDLRLCTSTLKQDLKCTSRTRGVAEVVLVMRNMRLRLVHDWDAKLATFPYLRLSGSSRVTVRSLAVSVRLRLSYKEGVVIKDVEVGLPDLDVHLTCASAFSSVVLSVILAIFKASLQDQLQKQMGRILLHLLKHEAGKWNESTWKNSKTFVPERLLSRALTWMYTNIPPEGLPI